MESQEQLIYQGRPPVDDAGKEHKRRWHTLPLGLLAVVVVALMSSLVLFKIVLFKGPSDKSNTTVSTFTSLRVPPASTTRVTRASPEPPSLPTSPEHRHALPHHHTSKNDCDAPSCRAVAQWLRSELDFNIDPCDHFYKYVCNKYRGGWNVFSDGYTTHRLGIRAIVENTENIPPTNQLSWQKAAAMYRACLYFVSSYDPED
ncbi:uncharacterized protein LOC142802960 [Rhipicephalus microplus]|uniref:uncharacterized protein LOC142802960 n=1 Tax=Rhipicephalus microplus TaxID=6941 RepID=UPI003F6CA480